MAQHRSPSRRVTLAGITTTAIVAALRCCASWSCQDLPRRLDLAFQAISVLPRSWPQSPVQLQPFTAVQTQHSRAASGLLAWPVDGRWCKMRLWRRAIACRATAEQEGADQREWKDAYKLEVERNHVLREQLSEQLMILGKTSTSEDAIARQPEACDVDWSINYERLAACNNALADEIAGLQRGTVEDKPVVVEKRVANFNVKMPNDDSSMNIELLGFFGGTGAFYSLCVDLPLGLKLTKVDHGSLMGAFLVEEVMEGGSVAAVGEVVAGDVLHAVTMVGDQADLGMRTEDFVSSLVGGLGRFRQSLMDASFIDSTEDLMEIMKSNMILGSDTKLALVFERDVSTLAPPATPLQPQSDV
mmetsp:Transcript_73093/g.144962  ORF Transcript_73093/g.144962 Transcript_73093/m.144962 type:complete len:359 (+) Transcript_73093:57-1133(+)|eukprot:CAMPEP_0172700548 /NCGR_PEP_ID=MMETSP1074-20121228/30980_1 /TAXON_ID=2916 /ORGANISM="Ceratium fusus, Strain PA161109" /LENGTH=358 /DNA_ID=CAMNT_0013521943 /DNA_START=37 /DNA_END=1113 /DNA_ORIENTATION=+